MFNVGDEVLIKGKIAAFDLGKSGNPYWVAVSNGMGYWLSEWDITDKTYEQGLTDAWQLAKKIAVESKDGGIPCDAMCVMFGTDILPTIFTNFTFEDCRDKIEAYEKEKEIKVGMIVVFAGEKWIVAEIKEDMLKLWSGKEILEARKSSCEPTHGIIEVSNVLDR